VIDGDISIGGKITGEGRVAGVAREVVLVVVVLVSGRRVDVQVIGEGIEGRHVCDCDFLSLL